MSEMQLKAFLRRQILTLGRKLPGGAVIKLGNLVRDLELDNWMKAHNMVLENVVTDREELFDLVASEVGELPVLYLEFGVATGEATRAWSSLLKHPETLLHGFDSFRGLPERWLTRPMGSFSTGGIPPDIADPRVSFFRGRFEDTLPKYERPQRDVVIINMDADLYSSTIFVLRRLRHLFRAGTYLYFDEFSCYGHEERAFRDFVEETGFAFALRGGTRGLLHVLFQCTEA